MCQAQIDAARMVIGMSTIPEPKGPIKRTVEDGLVYYQSADGQGIILSEQQDAELRAEIERGEG